MGTPISIMAITVATLHPTVATAASTGASRASRASRPEDGRCGRGETSWAGKGFHGSAWEPREMMVVDGCWWFGDGDVDGYLMVNGD